MIIIMVMMKGEASGSLYLRLLPQSMAQPWEDSSLAPRNPPLPKRQRLSGFFSAVLACPEILFRSSFA